jgi:hypothetical protein
MNLRFTLDDTPHPNMQAEKVAERLRQRTYNASAAGRERRKRYRHENSKWATDSEYLSRRIVAIDGEGINLPNGDHHYILLAISGVPPLTGGSRLSTLGVLEYLWRNLEPESINVIYGGSYDFNHWVRDLGRPKLEALYASRYTGKGITYGPYQLKWLRGKHFSIKRDGRLVTINDVGSYFQQPFVNACDLYLSDNPTWNNARGTIVREKARRGIFRPDEIENISDYNQLELDCLSLLVSELRARLNKVGLRPRRWDSPGAIAAALFMREGIKAHRDMDIPLDIAEAARYAYFGGRFEVIRYGISTKPAWEYDINSAYPHALSQVPSLAGGTWERISGDAGQHPFALYKVIYRNMNPDNIRLPGPIPARCPDGSIVYPMEVEGWVWSPEMETLRLYAQTVKGVRYSVAQTFLFHPASSVKPFAFIDALYLMRKALKKGKDGAHLALKLALNSLYGKTAQQVGWLPETSKHPLRLPPYHQLEWAGFVTSHCRAAILRAALKDIRSVVAFETDALFTTKPLPLDIGEGLGQFEQTDFASLTYIQSGHYYATQVDGTEVAKFRGVDRGNMIRADVERSMTRKPPYNYHEVTPIRFWGAGIALARNLDLWCRWLPEPKKLDLQPSGKRHHGACLCRTEHLQRNRWHHTRCPVFTVVSKPYPVEWINPDPAMVALEEMRDSEVDYG